MERQENKSIDLKELYGIEISSDQYNFRDGFVQIKRKDYLELPERKFDPSFLGHFLNMGRGYAHEEIRNGESYIFIRISAIPDFFKIRDEKEKFYDIGEVTADLSYPSIDGLAAKIKEMELNLHPSGLIPRTTYDALIEERMSYFETLRKEDTKFSPGAYSFS